MMLTHEEAVALALLTRHMLRADGQITDGELGELGQIADAIGRPNFIEALEKTKSYAYSETEELRPVAEGVYRVEAQIFIFEQVSQLAESDGVEDAERAILDLLQDVWKLA